MPVWFRQEGHSTLWLLDTKSIFAYYLTFSWVLLNLFLNCAKHTKNNLSCTGEEVTQVLGASSCRDLKTIVLDSAATSCSMVFQPSWSISGLLSVKAAAGYNSSSSVLTLLQTGTTPNRATISKVWLDNTCWLHKESKAFENSCST